MLTENDNADGPPLDRMPRGRFQKGREIPNRGGNRGTPAFKRNSRRGRSKDRKEEKLRVMALDARQLTAQRQNFSLAKDLKA